MRRGNGRGGPEPRRGEPPGKSRTVTEARGSEGAVGVRHDEPLAARVAQRHPRKWVAGGAVLSMASVLALTGFLAAPTAAQHVREGLTGSPTASATGSQAPTRARAQTTTRARTQVATTDTLPAWEVSCLNGFQYFFPSSAVQLLAPGSATAVALTKTAERTGGVDGSFPMTPPALITLSQAPGPGPDLSGQRVGVVASYDMDIPLSGPYGMTKAQAAALSAHAWIDILYHGKSMVSLGCIQAP